MREKHRENAYCGFHCRNLRGKAMPIVDAVESLMKDTTACLGVFGRRTTKLPFW